MSAAPLALRLASSLATRHDDPEEAALLLGAALARRRAWLRGTPKRCPGCLAVKTTGAFGLDASRRDGFNTYCRACRAAEAAARRSARV